MENIGISGVINTPFEVFLVTEKPEQWDKGSGILYVLVINGLIKKIESNNSVDGMRCSPLQKPLEDVLAAKTLASGVYCIKFGQITASEKTVEDIGVTLANNHKHSSATQEITHGEGQVVVDIDKLMLFAENQTTYEKKNIIMQLLSELTGKPYVEDIGHGHQALEIKQ